MAPVKKKHPPLRATFLGAWREYHRLNQDDVAERVGISRTLLSKMEQGKTPYTQRTLEALARVYECEPADLLSWHPVKKVTGEADVTILLRRVALIPEGEEKRAYGLIRNVWGPDEELPSPDRSHDQSPDATPHHVSEPSRKKVRQ